MSDLPADPAVASGSSRRPRRRWALSLRALMVLVLVVGGPLGWVARRAAIQRQAVATVRAAGGNVTYSDQEDAAGNPLPKLHEPWAPSWLRRIVGNEPFEDVVAVWFDARSQPVRLDAATLDAVARFDHLHTFFVNGPALTPGVAPPRLLLAADLARLGKLTQLREIRLFHITVDQALMDLLPTWPTLEKVTVAGPNPHLPGSTLRTLAQLPRLRVVILDVLESSTSADLAALLALPNLIEVQVGRAPVSDAGLAAFARRAQVATLLLGGTEVTEPTLAALAQIPTLTNLSFDGSRLPPGGLRHLAGANHLRTLSVLLDGQTGPPHWDYSDHRATAHFNDADLDALRPLPLTALGIMGMDVSDAAVASLLSNHNLTMLTLGGRGVTDATVAALLRQKPLYYLTLTDTGLTDAGLTQLATHPDLASLSLLDNPHLTDAGVASLASCPKLAELRVRQPSITQPALDAIHQARRRSKPTEVTRARDEIAPASSPR